MTGLERLISEKNTVLQENAVKNSPWIKIGNMDKVVDPFQKNGRPQALSWQFPKRVEDIPTLICWRVELQRNMTYSRKCMLYLELDHRRILMAGVKHQAGSQRFINRCFIFVPGSVVKGAALTSG